MQVLITKVMSLEQCKKQSEKLAPFVHNSSLCTKNEPGRGLCSADEGSPLVSKTKNKALIGIASWYNGCAQGKPDVYTAIYPHLEWIQTLLDL